jgi:hypothetical protein
VKNFFRKIFGIFPGESKSVINFVKLGIIWAIGSCIAETLALGQFTQQIGSAMLPNAYMITSFTMIFVSCLYMYFLRFTSPYKIMITTMIIAAITYFLISIFLFFNPPRLFWFFLQIFSYSFSSALTACFWIFIDQYHDLQDAKRVYALYNSAYFFGFTISGFLIYYLIKYIGYAPLYLLVVITMIYSIFKAKKISKTTPAMEDDGVEGIFASGKKNMQNIFKEFISSKYSITLVATSLIVRLLLTTTQCNYVSSLEKVFSSNILNDKIILTAFLGKCRAFISIGNIIIGLFFYRNIIKRIGLTNLILIPPIYFMSLYSNWMMFDALLIAIFAVIAVEGILYTLEDNNFNLLIKASPAKLKNPLRIINDSFFEPIGMLFSSIILMFLKSDNKHFGFILCIFFIVFSMVLRYLYPKSIFISLKQNEVHFNKKIKDWINKFSKKDKKDTIKDLFLSLKSDNETIKLLALKTLLEFKDVSLLNKIISIINKESIIFKIKVLDIFENSHFSKDNKIIELIKYFMEFEKKQTLISKSTLYLAKKGLLHPDKIKHHLSSKDLDLRASAIISLKHSIYNKEISSKIENKKIAKNQIDLLFEYDKIDEICIGLDILNHDDTDEAVDMVVEYLTFDNLKVQRKASFALSQITDEADRKHSFKILDAIKNSSDSFIRIHLLQALGNICDYRTVEDIIILSKLFRSNERRETEKTILKMGAKCISVLITIIKDQKLNNRSKILAAKILGKLSISELRKIIPEIIDSEIKKANFYFYFGNKVSCIYPLYELPLLKNELLASYRSIIDFILHLLGSASPIEDVTLVIKALHSKNAKNKSHAIETLEKNITNKIYNKISNFIEDIPLEYKLEDAKNSLDNPNLTLIELLDILEESNSSFDKIISMHLKAKLKMPQWRESIKEKIKKSNDSLNQYAYELLES